MTDLSDLLSQPRVRADVECLFDSSWYLNRYRDVAAAGIDALDHYLTYGAQEGRDPNPIFDTSWYIQQSSNLPTTALNPLVHYLTEGFREGRNPHPLFATSWYLKQYCSVRDEGINPLVHYLKFGAQAACDPHPLFGTAFYLRQNPDVAASGLNPLAHYITDGESEGRNPHPLFDISWYRAQRGKLQDRLLLPLRDYLTVGSDQGLNPHPLFDSTWYLKQLSTSLPLGVTAIEHYLEWGARNLLEPHPLFEAAWYLQTYPEVRAAGVNPLVHYLEEGSLYGTDPHPLFRGNWYKQRYLSDGLIQLNPLIHYLLNGAKAAHDPSPLFSTRWYTTRYKDVLRTQLNPLVHYVTIGRKENRTTLPIEIIYRNHVVARNQFIAHTAFEKRRHLDLMQRKPIFIIIVSASQKNDPNATLRALDAQMYSKFEVIPAANLSAQIAKHAITPDAFLMWLEPGDVLKPTALYQLASVINQCPDLDVVYGDEEVSADDGTRVIPFFKPAWSPDYLESFNYVGRAVCYRLSAAREPARHSNSPFQLLLRMSETNRRVVHLRQIIMRCPDRRFGTDEQICSDIEQLEAHNLRMGRRTIIRCQSKGSRLYSFDPDIIFRPSITMIHLRSGHRKDRSDLKIGTSTLSTFKSSLALNSYDVQTIVVDECCPRDNTINLARKLNRATDQASGEYILFIRDGIISVAPDPIGRMLRHFIKPQIGAVGPKILFDDGRIREFGQILSAGMVCSVLNGCEDGFEDYFFAHSAVRNIRASGLDVLLTRKSSFQQVGGFSENIGDELVAVDYCLKLVASGLRVVCDPEARWMTTAIVNGNEAGSSRPTRDLDTAIQDTWSADLIVEPFYNDYWLSTTPASYDGKQ
jgi:hypothetical protein